MGLSDPTPGWDRRALVVLEATFGTTPNPATTQAIEAIACDLGPAEVGRTRPQQDRTQGRDETLKYVEGRVDPIAFTLSTSVKTRATAATAAFEAAILKAAGLVETIGANAVYSLSSAPTLQSLSIYRAFGATAVGAEQMRGAVPRSLAFEFGDKELTLKASGVGNGKNHLGSVDAATVADNVITDIALGAGESYRFGVSNAQCGWYQWESEIIKVTAVNYATDHITIARAQLGSTAAAHAAKPITPYIPALTLAGNPISEANVTVTLDGTATRCLKGSYELTTGADLLPGESGSKWIQGMKMVRAKSKLSLDFVLTRELWNTIGKGTQRKTVAVLITCGTGAGGQMQISCPTCEIVPKQIPEPVDDISTESIDLRVRGNTGNDSVVLTFL